jgi:hypothetical protein
VRFWTISEARAYLPRLRQLLDVLTTAALTAARARGNGKGSVRVESGGSPPPVTPQEAVAELKQGSIALRDLASGLVDFPARDEDGVVYFLCWRREDDELGWWHLPEDGFAGRRPLPRSPGPPQLPGEGPGDGPGDGPGEGR